MIDVLLRWLPYGGLRRQLALPMNTTAACCVLLLVFGTLNPARAADTTHVARKRSLHSSRRTATKRTKRHHTIAVAKASPKMPVVKNNMPPPGSDGEDHNDWFYRRRAWPNGVIDPAAYPKALAQARLTPTYHPSGAKHGSLATFAWQGIGPYQIDGRVTCIATHPTDSNTMYIGAASGGLWKTTDHGANWKAVSDTVGSLPIGCVTIDPVDPQILYLGQGECNNSGDSYPGNGLWKSTDGGNSWSYLGFGATNYIAKVIVDPRDHNTLYLASPGPQTATDTNRGVYKSIDGGATWSHILIPRLSKSVNSHSVGIIDLAMNPANSSQLVAFAWDHSTPAATGFSSGSSGPGTGVWRTTDAGTTWARIDTVASTGLPNGFKSKALGRGALLWANDAGVSYLYAAITRVDTNQVTHIKFDENFEGFYRSIDDGLTWVKTVDSTFRIPYGGLQGKDSIDIMNMQGGYNLYLAANPFNHAEVYFGGIDVLRSTNHGLSFTDITDSYSEYYVKGSREQHSDQHGLAFTAAKSGNDMVVVSDGGLFHTTDFGNTWDQWKGLPITMFYGIEPWKGGMASTGPTISASDLKLFGGTQDNGTVAHGLTSDPDYKWISAGDGGIAQSHPTDPNKIVTSFQNGSIYVRNTLEDLSAHPLDVYDTSHDNTPRWHFISRTLLKGRDRLTDSTESVAFIAPVVLDQKRPDNLYTARVHVYRAKLNYDDLESTQWYRWSPVIAGDTAHPNKFYYGDIETIGVGPEDNAGHPMLWAGGYIYLTASSAVWRTTVDQSRQDTVPPHWILVNKGLPGTAISTIVPDRSDSMTAYIATLGSAINDTAHILMTTNGGTTWTNISGNLPHSPVSALLIDSLAEHGDPAKKNTVLIAGTDVGVFVTTNGGKQWESLNNGLPTVVVGALSIYKNLLIAATHGRSLYAMDISDLQAGALDVADASTSSDLGAEFYPNPVVHNEFHVILNSNNVSLKMQGEAAATTQCRLTRVSDGLQTVLPALRDGSNITVHLPSETASGAYVAEIVSSEQSVLARGRITVEK